MTNNEWVLLRQELAFKLYKAYAHSGSPSFYIEHWLRVADAALRVEQAGSTPDETLREALAERIAYSDSGDSLEVMTALMLAVLNAKTNGAALGEIARFRKAERLDAVRRALATPTKPEEKK